MPNVHKAQLAGNEIRAMLGEVAGRWPLLSEAERRRMLDEQAPLMADLLARHTAALAEDMPTSR